MNTKRRTIVGGVDADPLRFPYYTRLLDSSANSSNDGFFCGASLIDSEFLLTAAHCAFPGDNITAVISGHDYSEGTGLVRKVNRIIPHIAYDDLWTLANDIALLQIDPVPVEFVDTSFIRLASDRDLLQEGDIVTVIGMGLMDENSENVAELLQQVDLNVVTDERCREIYGWSINNKAMICTFSEGKDSCQGDSGGPLILKGETLEDDVQVGVVSWGIGCADPEFPGIYADVAYVLPWINSMICYYSIHSTKECNITVDIDIAPIRLDGDNDVCHDFSGAFYVNMWYQFQRCEWLREEGRSSIFCFNNHEAWLQCPLTCHSCTYEEDDDFFQMYYNDTDNGFPMSSSPTAFIIIIMFILMFCCQICFLGVRACQKRRRAR